METAKVDIRKLQLLNDRINQCLDALSQVRQSVHGFSHSQATSPLGIGAQTPGYGIGAQAPGYIDPRFGFAGGQGAQSAGWIGPGFAGGLAHTPFAQNPMAGFPQTVPGVGANPLASQFPTGQFPIWNAPLGLSHTGLESEALYNRPLSDPFLAVRVAQTFPYVQFPVPVAYMY